MDEAAVRAMWCETLHLDHTVFDGLDPGLTYRPPEAHAVGLRDLPTVRIESSTADASEAVDDETIPPRWAADDASRRPAALPSYQIVDEVGRGGMGIVYRALQRSLEREVAVKRVSASARDREARFTAEARVTGALDHPNIVPVHDLGHDGGGPLLIMKLVDGLEWRALLHPQTDVQRARAAELGAICRAALSLDSASRPASAQALREQLEAFLEHRESAQITERADGVLRRCLAAREAGAGSEHEVYADFAEAVAGFHQARLLWAENPRARAGEREARLAYARFGLANGDLGLAEAQAARLEAGEETAALRAAVAAARETRRRAEAEAERARESERRALERAERMLSQAYTEKARAARAVGDVLGARALASRALVTAESRDARELLFALGERTACVWVSPSQVPLREPAVVDARARWLVVREAARPGFGLPPVQLWDLRGELPARRRDLQPAREDVEELWFRRDGSVAARDAAGAVLVWDPQTGERREGSVGERAPAATAPCGLDAQGRLFVELDGRRFVGSGHEDHVPDVAWSPDGQLLATASYDHDVILWRRGGAAPERYLEGHTRAAVALAFHPGGGHLVSASFGKELRVWNLATGAATQVLKTSRSASRVQFAPDGARLAAALRDGVVALWAVDPEDPSRLELEAELRTDDWLYDLAWAPNGEALAAGGEGTRLHVWDGAGGGHRTWEAGAGVRSVAFHPAGDRVACGTVDGKVVVLDLADLRAQLELEGPVSSSLAFTPCGSQLCAGARDGVIRFWDLASGAATLALRGHRSGVSRVVFSPDGEQLASSSKDGTARLWAWREAGARVRVVEGPADEVVEALAVHPDGWAVSGSRAGKAHAWGPVFRPPPQPELVAAHGAWVWNVAIDARGERIATSGLDAVVRVWSRDGACSTTITGQGGVRAVAFDPRGGALATAGGDEDPTVRVWSLPAGEGLHALVGHSDAVHDVAYGPEGTLLASAGGDGVRVWDTASGECLQLLQHAGAHIVEFAPDGALATIGSEGLRLWRRTEAGFALARSLPASDGTRACAFDRTARYLAVVGLERRRVIELFDLSADGDEAVLLIRGHEDEIGAVCFSADGAQLLSASHDRTLRAWPLADALGTPSTLEARSERATSLSVRDLELVTLPRNHLVPAELDP